MNDQVPMHPHDPQQYQVPQPAATHPGYAAQAMPHEAAPNGATGAAKSRSAMVAMWLAIGMLVAAALLGGFFIIVGDQSNIAGRAWLTLLLVGAFAGAVVLDAGLATGPNRWYMAASTIVNALLVAVGLLKVWNGWLQPADTASPFVWSDQFFKFLAVIILLRAGIVFTQFYGRTQVFEAKNDRYRIAGFITLGFTWLTLLLLAIPAALPEAHWPDWWWRVAGAAALIAVVSAVIPLIIRAFEPKAPKPVAPVAPWGNPPHGYAPQAPYQGQPPVFPGQPQAYAGQPQGYTGRPQAYAGQSQGYAPQRPPQQAQAYLAPHPQSTPAAPQPQYGRTPNGPVPPYVAPAAPTPGAQPQPSAAPAAPPAPQPQYGRTPNGPLPPQAPQAPAPAAQPPTVPAPAIPSLADVETQSPDDDTEISHRG